MEKTKKLFAYLVVFAAIVCLFAGVAMQSNLANAAGSPQVKVDKIYATDGTTELDEGDVVISVPAALPEQNTLKNEKSKVESGDIAPAVKETLTEIAKKIDSTADYEAMVYGDPMKIEMTGGAATGAIVTFDLTRYSNPVDFILFKAENATAWQVIKPEVAAAAAANAAGNDSISFRIPGSGTVMFGGFSQAKANEIKAAKEAGEKDACCKCCAKGCPFCSFLCKDGKCYCWVMYVVIALAVILVILVVVLVVVKSKAKKVAAAKKEEIAAAEAEEKKEETKKEEK